MKRDPFPILEGSLFPGELIIDNFAGGGGTSTGLEAAFGRPVDIAINHDAEALAMHQANHPHTLHLCESVWDVKPLEVTKAQPVGLVWLSPDCKHFSKAKGGKPVEKKIRGLAWVTLRWAALCKPRVIMLENVEEFTTWGPLLMDGAGGWRPDPARKGRTFASFVHQLREHGYAVEWKELRACDYGAPTIRKRFFLCARRDGLRIRWPKPTHGAPHTREVKAGRLQPWRTAAECIDWSIPCPSIFERSRPLAEATMRRIAKGVMRYVVEAEEPFIVDSGAPFITEHANASSPRSFAADEPLRTQCAQVKGGHFALVAPSIVPLTHQGGDRIESATEPFKTITGAHRGEKALMSATLVQTGYGERRTQWRCGACGFIYERGDMPVCGCSKCGAEDDPIELKGQEPRALDIEKPIGTLVATGKHAVVSAFLAQHNNHRGGVPNVGRRADAPISTVTASGGQQGVVAAQLVGVGGRAGQSRPRSAGEPVATLTAKADTAIVTAHVTKFRAGAVGSALDEPLHTVTAGGQQARPGTGNAMGVVTSNLVKLRGTCADGQPVSEPLHTVSAGGNHLAEVRAFLLSYYGSETDTDGIGKPMRTVTSRDRFGLVTIKGQDYQIVDIGLRMLDRRELFNAQGFPRSYVIGDDEAQGLKLSKSASVRMCGNSVCPPLAEALARANFGHEAKVYGVAA